LKLILIIVLDLCSVFVVLRFHSWGREKACPFTNHKVKKSATVYKLNTANFVQWLLLKDVTRELKVHTGTTKLEQFIIIFCGPFTASVC
jgi:hypothetical protein